MNNSLIIFDTDCLSCFLMIDEMFILKQLYDKIIIPQQVYDEFDKRNTQHLKRKLDQLMKEHFIEKEDFELETPEYLNYKNLHEEKFEYTNEVTGKKKIFVIGKGEAAAIILAQKYNATIASNNTRDVIQLVKRYNLNWMRTGDILHDAINNNLLTIDEASVLWTKMLKKGRYLNPKNFKDYKSTKEYFNQ